MPSPIVLSFPHRPTGCQDRGTSSNTERQFSLLPACPFFLLESRPAFPSLRAGVALQCTNTPMCPQHAAGEKLELGIPEPQKIS